MAWQNVLGAFHSQQYWLVGLSFTAIALAPFTAPASPAWRAGMAAALLALGSGFLAAVVILLVLGGRLLRASASLRSWWPTVLLLTALVATGDLTRARSTTTRNSRRRPCTTSSFTCSAAWSGRSAGRTGPDRSSGCAGPS